MSRPDEVVLQIRAPERVAKFAQWIGNDALTLILQAKLHRYAAEDMAGKDDTGCFMNLLEEQYLWDVVGGYVAFKTLLQHEAQRILADHEA